MLQPLKTGCNKSFYLKNVFLPLMMGSEDRKIKIAILDLNEGKENQGMRCIREIINQWGEVNHYPVQCNEFEVRVQQQVPDTSFDIYISSGGPGSPLESEGSIWENKYFSWLHQLQAWNEDPNNFPKKNVFFICHSYQLVCRYYGIGTVCERKSTSFGVFPIHKLNEGEEDVILKGLANPFYSVDSRDYQVIKPNHKKLAAMGGKLLALEKDRPHIPLERAIMAVRFNDYFFGTQFHPEADAMGMTMYLKREDKKQTVIANHGEAKYNSMVEQLSHPEKIMSTYNIVLPNFLNNAVDQLIAV